jgi:hypothetical protein
VHCAPDPPSQNQVKAQSQLLYEAQSLTYMVCCTKQLRTTCLLHLARYYFACTKHTLLLHYIPYLYILLHPLQKGLIMGKPMGRHPITHYKNPNEPLVGSTKQVRSVISALPGCSIFDQPVDVQKVVKPDQCFLKTWSRANRPPTLTCDSSRVTQIWETLLRRPRA